MAEIFARWLKKRGRTYTADATQDFQQQNHSFESVSGYFAFTGPDNLKLVGRGQPLPVTGILVTEGFFKTLGVEPSFGRLFASEEFVQHSQPVALLSYPFGKAALVVIAASLERRLTWAISRWWS